MNRFPQIGWILCWRWVLACLALSPDMVLAKEVPFAMDVPGPFKTGTFEIMWIDEARDELATAAPHDKRHLLVQIWYPADYEG